MYKGIIANTNELVTFKNSQGQEIRGTILQLSQGIIVFEIYNPYSVVQLSEVLIGLKVVRANKEIYNGDAVVVNIVNTGMILVVSATLSESHWKSTLDVSLKGNLKNEIRLLIQNFEDNHNISYDFRMNVLAIRSFLSDVRNWIERLEPSLTKTHVKLDAEFMLNKFGLLFDKMNQLGQEFHKLASNVTRVEEENYRAFVQNLLHPYFMSSPFPYRCYSKPLGYAGDYMMMQMIQRENSEGPNLFSKFINVFYTNIPIANSVKNRTVNLVRLINEGVKSSEQNGEEFNSLSIGCGPALEVKKFLESNSPSIKCNFGLLDFNKETLNYAVEQANSVKGEKHEIIGEVNSVHELLKRSVSGKSEKNKYDLVYCSGLFDYLSDKVCSKLIKLFYSMVKPGGKVFVTNMHSNNYDNRLMELLLEWYLVYRDEKNMANLAPSLGERKMYTDQTGVNLCLEITKI